MFKDRSGPGEEGGSVDVIWSQVDAAAMAWPFAVFQDWEGNFSSHSPSTAQAWVQSSGVLALHPINAVRIRPPWRASAGSFGSAVVARN